MTGTDWKPYQNLIMNRIEVGLQRLRNNPAYKERCYQQKTSGEAVDRLLLKLDEEERDAIRHHYEGETVKQNFELDETYLQGMRDCVHFLSCLGAFQQEVFFYE